MLTCIFRPFRHAVHARLSGMLALAIAAVATCLPPTVEAETAATTPYAGSNWLKRCRAGEWILYTSDFEDISLGGTATQTARLSAADTFAPCPDATPLLTHVSLGSTQIEYQGGDDGQRAARIVNDPVNAGNQVLRFWLAAPNVTSKLGETTSRGRIQLNAYNNKGAREMLVFMRARLSGGFTQLGQHYRAFDFLTISEFWNNAPWGDRPYPFRISVNLAKEQATPGVPLRFAVKAETISTGAGGSSFAPVWSQVQRNFEVPTERWMTIRYHLIEGNSGSGLFRMTVTPDGGTEKLVFDIRGTTHHPHDPAPDGFSHFNPLKLYTEAALLKAAKAGGADGLTIDWDNLLMKIRSSTGPIVSRTR